MKAKTLFFEFDKDNTDTKGYFFAVTALQKSSKWPNPRFEYLYSDGELIVGTNGHRLHQYKPDDCLPKGWYSPIKKTKTSLWLISVDVGEGVDPVQYEKLLAKEPKIIEFDCPSCEGRIASVLRLMDSGQCLNIGYFGDATPVALIEGYEKPETSKAIFFHGEKSLAMIMPMTV